jgi:hypothetical protein
MVIYCPCDFTDIGPVPAGIAYHTMSMTTILSHIDELAIVLAALTAGCFPFVVTLDLQQHESQISLVPTIATYSADMGLTGSA